MLSNKLNICRQHIYFSFHSTFQNIAYAYVDQITFTKPLKVREHLFLRLAFLGLSYKIFVSYYTASNYPVMQPYVIIHTIYVSLRLQSFEITNMSKIRFSIRKHVIIVHTCICKCND